MGYVEHPGDVARVWYSRQRENARIEQGYWYFETVLEARVVRDRLISDEAIMEAGIEVERDGSY